MLIIALTGKAGSGKDTVAEYLALKHGARAVSFKSPIIAMAQALGLSAEQLTDRSLKEKVDPTFGVSPRYIMQTLGLEWGRDIIHPDLWLRIAEREIRKEEAMGTTLITISDLRFDNEAQRLKTEFNTLVVKLIRPNAPEIQAHGTEVGLSPEYIDLTLENNGTKEELYRKCEQLMEVTTHAGSR